MLTIELTPPKFASQSRHAAAPTLMNRQRPRLKNGVDLQLQTAFQEGNWSVVARLAEKRARTLNDSYYEIVKLCAESQLDDTNAKFAAVTALWQFVKDGTVVKDADGIDLLEWATLDLTSDDDFVETLGPLRVRTVKAAPKDKNVATRCLESCLLHWDLVSAQQIAAIMDKSFPQERSFMFWNIAITHMLSTSPQSPPEKKKLYGMLAQKQIERAAQSTEQAEAAKPPARGVNTEEEILLLYDIVQTHGSPDDFGKLIASPLFCPVAQFRQGRKELFQRVAAKYQKDGDWQAVFKLCQDCISQEDESGQPSMLASDWTVWQQFIAAAGELMTVDAETPQKVQDLLLKVIKSSNLRPIYKRNVSLARVSVAFTLQPSDDDVKDGAPSSLRIRELIHYIDDQVDSPACFDDIKPFIEKLDAPGMKTITYEYLPKLSNPDILKSARIQLVSLKTQYFVSSCPSLYTSIPGDTPKVRCTICSTTGLDSVSCSSCLSKISKAGLEFYKSISSSEYSASFQEEVLPEIAILVAYCSIRLAVPGPRHSPLSSSSARHLLRALLIVEHQLFLSPKHSVLSLLAVQLHILLGSAYRAREVWDVLGVKRTVVDSLGPLFYDRFSTISPSAISPSDKWGEHLIETLKSHYEYSLKLRMPRRLIDAFEEGNYSSVLAIPKYIDDLRRSSARAMSLVEEARTERLLGTPVDDLLEDARFVDVDDDMQLAEVIDYGSFPRWDCSTVAPLHARLQLGPPPSNHRFHLSLLSEAYHDILTYKPPTSYKAPAASSTDQTFVLESMSRLSNSMTKFLHRANGYCTPSEMVYFEAISILTTLIPLCAGSDKSAAAEVSGQLTDAVKSGLESLRVKVQANTGSGIEQTVSMLKAMHDVAMFRDTAVAIKLAAQWISGFNEREKARDRSGNSNLPKDIVTQIKSLQSATDAALKEGKAWMAKLKDAVSGREFEAEFRNWVFEDGEEIGRLVEDGTVAELVGSWRMNVKGWQQVKWE